MAAAVLGGKKGQWGSALFFLASSNARAWALGDLKVATHFSRGRNCSVLVENAAS